MSSMSRTLLSRVGKPGLHARVCQPRDLMKHFANGQSIGWSGFSPAGYPKVVPLALADHVEKNRLQGRMRFDLFAGASVGTEVEDRWADLHMTRRRAPYQSGSSIRRAINQGEVDMTDIHLSIFAQNLEFGFYQRDRHEVERLVSERNAKITQESTDETTAMREEGRAAAKHQTHGSRATGKPGHLDIGIIEVSEILPDGGMVLGAGIGIAPEVADKARKIILEVNTSLPSYYGLHDIVPDLIPPHRRPFMISRPDDRIGNRALYCDPDKIVGIVESTMPDNGLSFSPPDDVSINIANHIIDFLGYEVRAGRLPENLLPLQSGVGNIANAVIAGLADGPFSNVQVWTEVLQDTMLDFFDSGKLSMASTAALSLSPDGFSRFYGNWDKYAPRTIIRPQQITNHPEMIRRLGVLAMNTPVEVDIYGHVNSTHVAGTKMLHGLGGSGDFLRSGYISFVHTPSARATKTDPTGITCIVPMVSHCDHTEHDIDVIVTEQGLADVRGMVPRERARHIIMQCAHPDYRDMLLDYLRESEKECLARHAGHEPHMLSKVMRMYQSLEQHGSMKHVDNWV